MAVVLLAFYSQRQAKTVSRFQIQHSIVVFSGIAYLFFLLAWIDLFIETGKLIKVSSFLLLLFSIFQLARNIPSRRDFEVFGLGILTTLAVNCIAAGRGVVDVSQGIQHTVAVRYWTSADNLLPSRLAEGLLGEGPLRPFILGDWKSSDRPPLLSGVLLMFRQFEQESFFLLSSVTLIVFLVSYSIFKRESDNHALSVIAAMSVCFVPGVFLNEIYTWPKLLAGVLTLIALDQIVSQKDLSRFESISVLALTFGVLTHGSTFFVVPVFLLILIYVFPRQCLLRNLMRTGMTCFVVYLPWYVYQSKFDPPGNRLMIWHLAGEISPLSSDNPIRSILNSYQSESFVGILNFKLQNLFSLFWSTEQNNAIIGYRGIVGLFKTQIASTVWWSIGPTLMIVLVCALFTRVNSYTKLLAIAITGVSLMFAILEMGADINSRATLHVSPMFLTIGLSILGCLTVLRIKHRWIQVVVFGTIPLSTVMFFGFFHGAGEAAGWDVGNPPNKLGFVTLGIVVFSWACLCRKSRGLPLSNVQQGQNA